MSVSAEAKSPLGSSRTLYSDSAHYLEPCIVYLYANYHASATCSPTGGGCGIGSGAVTIGLNAGAVAVRPNDVGVAVKFNGIE